jgi:hypothetical protein
MRELNLVLQLTVNWLLTKLKQIWLQTENESRKQLSDLLFVWYLIGKEYKIWWYFKKKSKSDEQSLKEKVFEIWRIANLKSSFFSPFFNNVYLGTGLLKIHYYMLTVVNWQWWCYIIVDLLNFLKQYLFHRTKLCQGLLLAGWGRVEQLLLALKVGWHHRRG